MALIFKIISLLVISFTVFARVQTPFAIVKDNRIGVKNFGTYSAWGDGTYSTTCDGYRNAPTGKIGSTVNGIYRITLNSVNTDVYCLMNRNSYGYVLIGRVAPASSSNIVDSNYSSVSFMSKNLMRYYRTGKPIWVTYFNGTCSGRVASGWTGEVTTNIGYSFGTVSGTETRLGNAFDIVHEGQLNFDNNNVNTYIRRAENGSDRLQYDNGNKQLFYQVYFGSNINCSSTDYLDLYVR